MDRKEILRCLFFGGLGAVLAEIGLYIIGDIVGRMLAFYGPLINSQLTQFNQPFNQGLIAGLLITVLSQAFMKIAYNRE